MNSSSKRLIVLLLSFILFSIQIFAQDAVNRALDLINKNLILGDYDKAYSYAKFVVNFYDGEEIPSDVQDTVCEAISERGKYLVEEEKWNDVLVMEDEIKNYPASIKKALNGSLTATKEHFRKEEEEKEKARLELERQIAEQKRIEEEARIRAEKEAETKRLIELYELQKKQEQERLAQQQKEEQEQLLLQKKLEEERIAQQKKLQEELDAQKEKMEQELQAQQKQLEEEKLNQLKKFEEEIKSQQKEFEEERLSLQLDFEQEKQLQKQKLENERTAMLKQIEEQQKQLQQEYENELQEIKKKQQIEIENSIDKKPQIIQIPRDEQTVKEKEEISFEEIIAKEETDKTFDYEIVIPEENQKEIEKLKIESEQRYVEEISKLLKEINESNTATLKKVSKNNVVFIIALIFVALIFIGAFALLISIWLKQMKKQESQMKEVIKSIQNQPSIASGSTATAKLEMVSLMLQIPGLNGGFQSFGNKNSVFSFDNKSSLTSVGENEKAEIVQIVNECTKYGNQIDEITGRKNDSSRVGELVVKISQHFGYSEYDCILNYAAALVHDIGFLGINSSLLKGGKVNDSDYKQIQNHVLLGEKMLFFVNSKYKDIFIDAVTKHHENLDGSGYPNGLKDRDIPFIARVLRVAESYVAMVSNRSYKIIKDRDSAIKELKKSPNHYDAKIVDALDLII